MVASTNGVSRGAHTVEQHGDGGLVEGQGRGQYDLDRQGVACDEVMDLRFCPPPEPPIA